MTVDTELARIYLKDRKTYDLCPDCMKELEDFLEGAQNQAESSNASNEEGHLLLRQMWNVL